MTNRRALLALLGAAPLAACQSFQSADLNPAAATDADYDRWYIGSVKDEPFDIPLVDRRLMDAKYARQEVEYHGPERPGTVVVDVDQRLLYFVEPDGRALRYGVGVGRQGFTWKGAAHVGRKAKWPGWYPTSTMIRLGRAPAAGREPGLDNPLGARALYLYEGNRDILFRVHGTNEPWSIGEQGSSGCIRMLNEDVADLYERVPVGSSVVVKRRGRGIPPDEA